jgi:hypothetical protein
MLVWLTIVSGAADLCPVVLVTGAGEPDAFTITFMNRGKLPIRRLEFNCVPARGQLKKIDRNHCVERNAYFLPANQYTVRYTYPGGQPGTVVVSLRSMTLGDGHEWKASKRYRCRTLRVQSPKSRSVPTRPTSSDLKTERRRSAAPLEDDLCGLHRLLRAGLDFLG